VNQRVFESVTIGDELPGFVTEPTTVQLMRYCAVTWNMHRIHFDAAYAAEEGYPAVLVQSHLHQAFLTKLCTDWMGPRGWLRSLSATVRRFAVPGDQLRCRGRVADLDAVDEFAGLVTVEIEEVRDQDGMVCAPGQAAIELPTRAAVEARPAELRFTLPTKAA
jgi:acyl dehydratase